MDTKVHENTNTERQATDPPAGRQVARIITDFLSCYLVVFGGKKIIFNK
jgi:hypothetical protein